MNITEDTGQNTYVDSITANDGNKTVLVAESTAWVVTMFATGKAQRGIVYATDSAPFPLVSPPPAADEPPIDYVVAQARETDRGAQTAMLLLAGLCFVAGILPGFVVDGLASVVGSVTGARMPLQATQPLLSIVPVAAGTYRATY